MLSRVILYSAQGYAMGDLDPSMVMSCVRTEEINGEHSLSLSTVVHLYIGMRILMQDTTGKWREYVVDEEDEEHSSGRNAIGTYHAMWSIQYDLSTTAGGVQWASVEEGTNEPVTASNALAAALTDSVMWRPGTCDVVTLAAASFYDNSCWEYLSIIVETWGGEVDAEITVDDTGVVTRKVALMAHLGSATSKRRFDWGRDLTRIRRIPDPGPYYCRVVPRGGSEGTDSDGVKYSDRCGIESENDGIPYLQDDEAAELFKTLLPDGTWFYPTKVVNYQLETKDDAEELYNKAVEDLYNHTRPNMSYEADVVQLAIAGLNIQGIALGDDVQCVDNGFGDIPLRIQGRVVSMTVNEMNPSDTTLTIGRMQHTLTDEFTSLTSTVGQVSSRVTLIESGGTSAYVRSLIDRMNQEINATDGWTYIVPNEGIIVYDIEVDDPIMGYNSNLDEYASSVVQIKGGGIRIANTRKPEFAGINDWDWKSVFDAGHIAAELVTAVNMTTGFIGNASSGTFIDLDNDVVRIGTTAQLGGRSVLDILDGIDATVTDVDVQFAENQSADTAPTTGWGTTAPAYREGYYIWQRTATTTGHGTSATTTYSDPVRINTHDGQDGQDGQDGANGKGISSIVEQYYLSTSSSTQTGGSWSETPAAYVSGRYYWTRTIITWSDNTTTTTTPVIARAINSANENALDARKVATNYLTFNSTTGVDVGYAGTSAKTRVNGSGVEIFDGDGSSAVLINTSGERIGHANEARLQMDYHSMYFMDKSNVKFFEAIDNRGTNSLATIVDEMRATGDESSYVLQHLVKTMNQVTVGGSRVPSNSSNGYVVVNSTDGYSILAFKGSYANIAKDTVIVAKYTTEQASYNYTMGSRSGNAGRASLAQGQNVTASGWGSHAEGRNALASGMHAHAEGYNTMARGNVSHAEGNTTEANGARSHSEGFETHALGHHSHAEGYGSRAIGRSSHAECNSRATGNYSHSEGSGTEAIGTCSHAQNNGTVAASADQTAIGRYNLRDASNAFAFIIGNGTVGANSQVTRSNAFAVRWDGSAPTQSANTGFDINTTNVNSVGTQAYRRCLGVVQVAVGVTVKVAVAKGKSIVLGKLPAGYRPAQTAIADAGSFNRRASIATNGDITLKCETAVTSTSWSVTVRAVFLTP